MSRREKKIYHPQVLIFRLIHFVEVVVTRNLEISSKLIQIQNYGHIERINSHAYIVVEAVFPTLSWTDFPNGTYLYLAPNFKDRLPSEKILKCQSERDHFSIFPVFIVSSDEAKIKKIGGVVTRTSEGYFHTLVRTLENILEKAQDLIFVPGIEDPEVKSGNSFRIIGYLLLTTLMRILRKGITSRLFEESWHIGLQPKSLSKLQKGKRIIPNAKGHYYADPFVIEHDERAYIFCEDYSIKNCKGVIKLFEILNNEILDRGTILEESFHLSFPYIFLYENEYFMIPESTENGQLTLYKALSFPFNWMPHSVLPHNLNGADPMIFKHSDHWWLFINTNDYEKSDFSSALSVYWSKEPINGPWIPHPGNPLLGPSNLVRNAGIDVSESPGKRFAQIQDIGLYGAGLRINEIKVLDKEEYREEEIQRYYRYRPISKFGFHHMSHSDRFTVFDLKIRKWKITSLSNELRRTFQRLP